MVFLLQSAASPANHLPEIVACIAIVGAVFKLGQLHAEGKSLKSSLETEIKSIREVMSKILLFIEESQKLRSDWAGFRRVTEDCQKDHSEQIAMLRERSHTTDNLVHASMGRHDLLDQRVATLEGNRRVSNRREEDREV